MTTKSSPSESTETNYTQTSTKEKKNSGRRSSLHITTTTIRTKGLPRKEAPSSNSSEATTICENNIQQEQPLSRAEYEFRVNCSLIADRKGLLTQLKFG